MKILFQGPRGLKGPRVPLDRREIGDQADLLALQALRVIVVPEAFWVTWVRKVRRESKDRLDPSGQLVREAWPAREGLREQQVIEDQLAKLARVALLVKRGLPAQLGLKGSGVELVIPARSV